MFGAGAGWRWWGRWGRCRWCWSGAVAGVGVAFGAGALGAAVPEGGFGGRGAGGPEVVVFPVGLGVPAGVFGACEVAAVGGQGAAGVGGDVVALGGGHVQGAVGVHGVAPAGGVFEAVVAAAEAAQVAGNSQMYPPVRA